MKTATPITLDELLDEVGVPAMPDETGWHTTAELAVCWNCKQDKVQAALRKAHRAGCLEVRTVRRTRMDGKPCDVPAYRIKAKGKAGRK